MLTIILEGAGGVFCLLAGAYPKPFSRTGLAERLDMAASGGTFAAYLSRLRTAGLITTDGKTIKASAELMEG